MLTSKYVVWDFDGTLAYRPQMWSGAVLSAIHAAGVPCDASAQDVRPFLQSGFPWHRPDVIREPGRHPDEWWASLDPVFVPAVCSISQVDRIAVAAIVRRVRDIYTDPSTWVVYDDVHQTLEALAAAGWTQILLSNHVPELPSIVRALGLSQYMTRIFNSAETGVEKPHPAAYRQVLDVIPNGCAVWMLGDSLDADVLGAEAAGMNAILVRREHPRANRSCSTL